MSAFFQLWRNQEATAASWPKKNYKKKKKTPEEDKQELTASLAVATEISVVAAAVVWSELDGISTLK